VKKAKAIELVRTHDAPPPARVVERDLAEAETKLNRLLDSSESLISEICHYLVDGGGKRLRAARLSRLRRDR
jgi:geranylgeranyl pyrophosphate synthase